MAKRVLWQLHLQVSLTGRMSSFILIQSLFHFIESHFSKLINTFCERTNTKEFCAVMKHFFKGKTAQEIKT